MLLVQENHENIDRAGSNTSESRKHLAKFHEHFSKIHEQILGLTYIGVRHVNKLQQ